MTYSDTLDWMFSQLPMYQRKGAVAFKKDLTNSILFSERLGHPEQKFPSVHVGGTNGKGSTSHIIASVLQEAGYRVGLYTSPHLVDFRERIRINGRMVSKQFVIGFIKKHRQWLEKQQLSFFEMTVGMAFDYFARSEVDIAIIEVGLGGRLDSTNIINPELTVITNIGFDHMQFLGNSLGEIAFEKAGIIKLNTPVIIGESHAETAPVFLEKAEVMMAPIEFADQQNFKVPGSDLQGNYQKLNFKTALCAIENLRSEDYKITNEQITSGFGRVALNTGLKGRWQELRVKPRIILDTAHNEAGLRAVMNQLQDQTYSNLHMVIGFANDKPLSKLVDLFPEKGQYYFCKPDVPRGLPADKTKSDFEKKGRKGELFSSVKKAYRAALDAAEVDDLIFVGGSTFVVAETLQNFE